MDKESSRGIGEWRLLAPRLNNRNLSFGSLNQHWASAKAAAGKSTLGRALQCDALAFLPHSTDTCWLQTITHTHTYTHICIHISPPPIPRRPSLWTTSLTSRSVTSAGKWLQVWMAAAGAGLLPLCKSCVYGVLCAFVAEVFFLFSHCTPKENSRVFFFSPHFLCYAVFFFNSLSSCPVYPPCHICMLCMDRLMANFAGTCD